LQIHQNRSHNQRRSRGGRKKSESKATKISTAESISNLKKKREEKTMKHDESYIANRKEKEKE
jgi:hypothetical protein